MMNTRTGHGIDQLPSAIYDMLRDYNRRVATAARDAITDYIEKNPRRRLAFYLKGYISRSMAYNIDVLIMYRAWRAEMDAWAVSRMAASPRVRVRVMPMLCSESTCATLRPDLIARLDRMRDTAHRMAMAKIMLEPPPDDVIIKAIERVAPGTKCYLALTDVDVWLCTPIRAWRIGNDMPTTQEHAAVALWRHAGGLNGLLGMSTARNAILGDKDAAMAVDAAMALNALGNIDNTGG